MSAKVAGVDDSSKGGRGVGGLEVSEKEVEVDHAPICLFLHTDGRLGDKCGGTWSLSL